MKYIARAFLRLATAAIPVVIAACYGAPYGGSSRSRPGKVIDEDSKSGIPGIKVTCVGASGQVISTDYSDPSGYVDVHWRATDEPCDALKAEDTDGAQNGGQYAPHTADFDPNADSFTLSMKRQ